MNTNHSLVFLKGPFHCVSEKKEEEKNKPPVNSKMKKLVIRYYCILGLFCPQLLISLFVFMVLSLFVSLYHLRHKLCSFLQQILIRL